MAKKLIVLPMARRPRGSSKWFNLVFVEGKAVPAVGGHAGAEHRPMKSLRCRKLQPSFRQAVIITACLAEADDLMMAFRLTPARISLDRVHLLPPRTFARLVGHDRHLAISLSGHIYLNARYVRRGCDLAILLTHELAHLISFIILFFRKDVAFPMSLVGLQACAAHLGRLDYDSFGALNEVTTELAAHYMRVGLLKKGILRPADADFVDSYRNRRGYGPLLVMLTALLCPTVDRLNRFSWRLVRSMLTGSPAFFRTLRRHGLLEELLDLSADPNDIASFLLLHGYEP